jgi:hypothetical protein
MTKKNVPNQNLPAVSKPTAGGVGWAIIGGMIAGSVGALAGGVAGALVGNASAEWKQPIKSAAAPYRSGVLPASMLDDFQNGRHELQLLAQFVSGIGKGVGELPELLKLRKSGRSSHPVRCTFRAPSPPPGAEAKRTSKQPQPVVDVRATARTAAKQDRI